MVKEDWGAEAGGSAPTTDAANVVDSAMRVDGDECVRRGDVAEEGGEDGVGTDERCSGCLVYHLCPGMNKVS